MKGGWKDLRLTVGDKGKREGGWERGKEVGKEWRVFDTIFAPSISHSDWS